MSGRRIVSGQQEGSRTRSSSPRKTRTAIDGSGVDGKDQTNKHSGASHHRRVMRKKQSSINTSADGTTRKSRSVSSDSRAPKTGRKKKPINKERSSSLRRTSASVKTPSKSGSAGNSRQSRSLVRSQARNSYGIDEPLAGEGNAGSQRSVRSARSGTGMSKSEPGGFVDACQLREEDLVGQTLEQTAGPLGVIARPKVIDFNARRKERRRISVWKTVVKVSVILAIAAAIALVAWVLFLSPVFRLDSSQIKVSGENEWVSKSRIVSIADKQTGKSLLLVSSGDVEQEFKDIPGVSKATVEKVYPKGLNVSITSQEPAAMIKTPDNNETAVDGHGRVLNTVGNHSTSGIPVIEVGDVKASLHDRSVQQALSVLDSLPHDMRGAITKVTAKTQDSVTTELNGGDRVIIWGDASDIKLKKAVVDKIINDPSKIGDKHQVDVSAPLRPIIK
jgi:cell division protein FtsQ